MRGFVFFLAVLLLALPSFAQSGVDNCCQTGRACATEADWVQGWFDYQAGQCAAPAASSSAIDNCCQAGRACATDADWVQGWHDYRNGPMRCAGSSCIVASRSGARRNFIGYRQLLPGGPRLRYGSRLGPRLARLSERSMRRAGSGRVVARRHHNGYRQLLPGGPRLRQRSRLGPGLD